MWSFLSTYWPGIIIAETLLVVWAWRRPMLPNKIVTVRFDRGCGSASGRPTRFRVYKARFLPAGVTVRVWLLRGSSKPVNVRLVDGWNFRRYKKLKRHAYIGGCVSNSFPIDLRVPRNGRWYVVLDLGGAAGRILSACEIVPEPLQPSLSYNGSLVEILDNVRRIGETVSGKEKRDVFISYAHKDGTEVATQLKVHLEARGIDVWIDQADLEIGKNLRHGIDRGIANSRFAAVILTEAFFEQAWTAIELEGLRAMEAARRQGILPVLHNVTMDQLLDYSPTLAGKISRSTGQHSISQIAAEIARVVQQKPELSEEPDDAPAGAFEEQNGHQV